MELNEKDPINYINQAAWMRQSNYRWVALALAILLLFGESYCYDNPMSN